MIDHVLGRPSVKFRKTQVFAVVGFWGLYLWRGHRHGPPMLRKLSRHFTNRLTSWQTTILLLLYLYVTRNFGKLVGLECPEPLANLYTRSYFRATWVTTALDAGFWSAMHLRPAWLRDLSSVIFTVYYLICAEQADEKVRKVRASLTLQHLRVSWDKPKTPYIKAFTEMFRPRLGKYKYPPRELRIPRPRQSSYDKPVRAWLYFDGPLSSLKRHDKIILDIPGGGFVAMDPRCHDDKLLGWAGKTGLPVLALDYEKAPEHPYPYALNECYDVYHTLIATKGACIGLTGEFVPKIVVSGDSAGGNLAVGMVLMLLQAGSTDTRRWQGESRVPLPESLVLTYPALDMNIGNWMTDEQMALIKDRRSRGTNRGVIRRKSDDYRNLTPDTPHGSEDEEEGGSPHPSKQSALPKTQPDVSAAHTIDASALAAAASKPAHLKTRLAMSSMISYFNDRILTPEMMRAMIILYVGPHARPDFGTDFLLSPLLAPESLLMQFPKTYFLTGERDPLVDDTVIFAGRLRQAKAARWDERRELGLVSSKETFNETDWVNVMLVPGISHGFLQFVSVFPEGWRYIFRTAAWMSQTFRDADQRAVNVALARERRAREKAEYNIPSASGPSPQVQNGVDTDDSSSDDSSDEDGGPRHHTRTLTGSSVDDDAPLQMSAIRASPNGSGRSGKTRGSSSGRRRRPAASSSAAAGPRLDAGGSNVTVIHASDLPAPRSRGSDHSPSKADARPIDGGAGDRPSQQSGSPVRRGAGINGSPSAATAGERRNTPRPETDAEHERRKREVSLHALASSDDLLGRRMKGLAGNLLMGRLAEGDVLTP